MIRVVHNLGGCGGTLLTRCLGVLPAVVVYSEMHPGAVRLYPHFDPLYQDRSWHGLLSDAEREHFAGLDLQQVEVFRALMGAFHRSAEARGQHLVLRDWSYLDFVGLPFAAPTRRLALYDALPADVPVRAVGFIRHPIDQWVSLCKHVELEPTLTAALFCTAWTSFLESLGDLPVYRYEAFSAAPQAELERMCQDLSLPYDPGFVDRFHAFDRVTGDFTRLRDSNIQAPPPRPAAADTRAALQAALERYETLAAGR